MACTRSAGASAWLAWACCVASVPVASSTAAVVAPAPAAALCGTDHDCNLNGACTGGRCACLAAWRGETCGLLSLRPAGHGAGLHAAPNSTLSAWGGAVVFDAASGRFLMYAAEMVGGCGINSWETNSRVVRASAASMDEPFAVDAEVKAPFAHEPTLARRSDGE